jgi:hypothetical protein
MIRTTRAFKLPIRWALLLSLILTLGSSLQVLGADFEQGCCGNSSCSTLNDDPLIPCVPGSGGDALCAEDPDGDQFPKCCDVGGCPA